MKIEQNIPKMSKSPKDTAAYEGGFRKQDWPFYWIVRTSNRYVQTMERRLKPIGLDVPSWRVLMCLHEDTYLSVSEIAEFSVIKLNTATKIIQRMTAQGLVTTRPRAEDLRVTEVTLTDEGDRQRLKARAVAETIFATAFADFSAEEQHQLNALLERVFNRLGEL